MAKFELPVYDMKTEEIVKRHTRNFIPVNLYMKFHDLGDRIEKNKVGSDEELFVELKELFLETFPELTEEEYMNCTDTAQVIVMFRDILEKATKFQTGNSKNK